MVSKIIRWGLVSSGQGRWVKKAKFIYHYQRMTQVKGRSAVFPPGPLDTLIEVSALSD